MDKTGYLDALTAYSRNPSQEIPPILEQYLNGIAKNGETAFHWPLLKPLIFAKMEQVFEELRKELSSETIPERPNVENVPFDVMHSRIMEALHKFNGAPFTIQRLCEMLIDPRKHYKRSDKFLRGLEKNVLVVSTVDPFGRKVVSESSGKHLVNGMDTSGSPFFTRDSSISSNLPPVPDWVSMATSPQNSPAADLPERKQNQLTSPDPAVTANGSGGLDGSKYDDSGKEPLTEKDTDKTVVTMDTSEAVSLAKEGHDISPEGEEECLGGDETSASSSSSSSEELSSSDTSESSDAAANEACANEPHASPWALAVNEGKEGNHTPSSDDADPTSGAATSSSDMSEESPEAPPLQSFTNRDSSLTSDADALSADPKGAPGDEQLDSTSPESSTDISSVQQDSLNDSTGFDNTFTQSVEKMSNSEDDYPGHKSESMDLGSEAENVDSSSVRSECDGDDSRSEKPEFVTDDSSSGRMESECLDSKIMRPESDGDDLKSGGPEFVKDDSSCFRLEPENDDSNSMESESDGNDLSIERPESSDSVAGNDIVADSPLSSTVQCNQSSSSTLCGYEEVVASSSVEACSKNTADPDSVAACDNVADLERLVDSVNPSSSSSAAASSLSSALHTLTTTSRNAKHMSPLADSSSNSDEPQAKRRKLSDENFSHLISSGISDPVTTSSCTEETSSSDYISTRSDMADTTSDFVSKNPEVSTCDDPSAEVQESMDVVTCSGRDPVELEDVDYTKEDRDDVASPPSQLSSSSDSQGFDVTSGVSTEEKQVTESVTSLQENTERKSFFPQNDSIPEQSAHD